MALTPTAVAISRGTVFPAPAIPAPVVFGSAAGMAILWWRAYATAKVLSPLQRRRTLLLEWRGGLWGIVLAVLTARLLPGLDPLAGWAAANAWWVAGLCVAAPLVITAVSVDVVPLRLVPTGFLRYLVDRGTFAFYLAMLTGSGDLAGFAAWIVGYNLLHELLLLRPDNDWTPRGLDAHRFFDAPPVMRQRIVDQWLDDAVRRPARRGKAPDLAFVYSLCSEVAPATAARQDAAVAAVHLTPPRLGNDPMAWHDRALRLVELAEAEIPSPGERQRRSLNLARARCASARGDIGMTRGFVDEALEGYEEATTRWRASGLHNVRAEFLAALALGAVPSPLATTPMPPEKILPRLLPLIEEPALVPLTRRWVLLGAAVCHLMLRQHDEAVVLHEKARALGSARRGRRRLTAERRAAGVIVSSRSADRRWDAVMAASWHSASGLLRFAQTIAAADEPLPVTNLSSWSHDGSRGLIRAAAELWVRGDHDTAGTRLEQAADALEADRLPAMAAQVLLQLGIAQRAVDPSRAYRNLRRAMEIREALRGGMLGADLRMLFGGGSEDLYVELVRLLNEAEFFPGGSWPPHPARTAFELVEQARARSMLELLGTALDPPAGPSYARLTAAEGELLAEWSRVEESGDTARMRSVRDRLGDVWRRLAEAGPEGAEYAQLRRGEPAGYDDIRRLLAAPGGEAATPPGPAHA
ncbi:hypothetical protein DMB42_27835 [Nonomuraea sp. WAC 01424]|uniref:hypothetical protein n=1 Tax=Nonomuraea sp. WAC 01424 TaxID=2203200 RepID=UPI000F765E47|nr:hypothetical protein [Nonomuraea sp. WAC 01424]RSN05748.1 hypothetical protein DMB42_27835 [Nonomuraea sp. WAC 01424]